MAPIWFHDYFFWRHFCVYFCTATYVDYLTFFTFIRLLTQPPLLNPTLTIGVAACNPNNRGSRVYPNYWDSRMQPSLLGLLHATLTIGAATCKPNGQGRRARPSQGRRCAWASPSRLGLYPCGLHYALMVWALPSQQLNEFIYYNYMNSFILHCKNSMNSYIVWIHICMISYI